MALRDASELLWPAVQETIHALGLGSSDAAAVKLAQRLAQTIDGTPEHAPRGQPDQKWAMRWLVPELLKVLGELGATPAARAAMTKRGDKPADAKPNGLAKLRAARGA